jgi:hypothetical protein
MSVKRKSVKLNAYPSMLKIGNKKSENATKLPENPTIKT